MHPNYAKIASRSVSSFFSNKSQMIHERKIHSCKYNDCDKKNKPSSKDILYSDIMLKYGLASLLYISQLAEYDWWKYQDKSENYCCWIS